METIAPLVRALVRAFYPDKYAVVIEPLLCEPFYLEDDEMPTGPLSAKFSGLSSTSIRRVLGILVKHSIVQKKEILTETTKDDDSSVAVSKVRRFYYYIDFVHFIKILSLRLEQMRQHIGSDRGREDLVEVPYVCQNCHETLDMMTASRFDFTCQTCGCALEEVISGEAASSQAKSETLHRKFLEQITEERDQRDGMVTLLKSAHNLGSRIPLNDPFRKMREIANEKRRAELPQVDDPEPSPKAGDAVAVSRGVALELAPWLRTTATGELTEDALRDTEARDSKRIQVDDSPTLASQRNREDDYAADYERIKLAELETGQGLATVLLNEPAPTIHRDGLFLFQDGGSIRAGDITEDNLEELRDRCTIEEYDAFVMFLKGHTEWDI